MPLPTEISPNSVTNWAQELPCANTPVVARESFAILQQLEQASLAANQRMAVLENLQAPIGLVLEHLQAQIVAEHPKSALLLSLAESYCAGLANQYQQLRRERADSDSERLNDSGDQTALTREAEYLAEQILFRTLDHQPAPPEVWSRLQTLFFGSRVKDRGPLYRMIALQLASTNRLSPRSIRDTYQLLRQLPIEQLIDLKATAGGRNRTGFFLPADLSAPGFGALPIDSRPLELTRLVRALGGKQVNGTDPQLIAELRTRWSVGKRVKDRRISPRRPLRTKARFGLSDIVQHLRDNTSAEDHPDLYAEPPTASFRATTRRNPLLFDALIVDISDNGCRLLTKSPDLCSGEIVCVNWGQDEQRIGTVVWFCKDGDQRECGIQWLMETPSAVPLRFDDAEAIYALSGRSPNSQRNILLFASQYGQRHERCWLRQHGQWQAKRLVIVDDQGLIEIAEPFPIKITAPLDQDTPPATPAADPTSAYQDVWDTLSTT